ncbi:MAG: prolyl oligopeptidase family serine peptidase [Planctomycetota bacterium]|nr:prolyl oligopeptidase family serine peptidase [Planctomycetota bacterium]
MSHMSRSIPESAIPGVGRGVLVVMALLAAGWFLASGPVLAGEDAASRTGYRVPPKSIADLIDAPPTPGVSIGPHGKLMLIMHRPSLAPISEIAQPEFRLAGIRINPRTNARARRSHFTKLSIKSISDRSEKNVSGLPPEARIQNVRWSPDGNRIAFTVAQRSGVELWTAEVRNGMARRLTKAVLNTVYGSAFQWSPDSQSIICRIIPSDRGSAPAKPDVPSGPTIRESSGRKAPARTYQDLLENAHDEDLFDHYLQSRVVRVSVDGKIKPMGSPGVITRALPSPDGRFILVETIHRPYSYLVPLSRFPRRIEVWSPDGKVMHLVADLPLREEIPIGRGAVATGPRSVDWRNDASATLYWVEAQDGGDPRKEADVRDRVYVLDAPFDGDPVELLSLGLRYSGMTWGSENLALAWEWWWKSRKIRTWIVNPSKPGSQLEVLFDRSFEDRYNDPGSPMLTETESGRSVLLTADGGKTLFLRGSGASPEGDRPFLDRLDLASRETVRLWRSEAPSYESVAEILDPVALKVLIRRESKTEPPNYFSRNLDSDRLDPITKFPHPAPQLRGVQKELIRYERADGVKLTATLYLPPNYTTADGPLPMLMWAYPREFKSAKSASQVRGSPHRFVRTSSHSPLLWLVHGYAVLDAPSMPIIGEGDEEPNDTYVKQLVASAQAAVDEVVRRGVADPDRIAIGGHSYGAFMTANLLAHSDLYRAGIARSGAYNRTLTPFGFQAEERTFWEAPEVYFAMSPFMHAQKVNEPILMIHGEADNNSGTFPMQSKRFYNALKGHGAIARLVMLPHESHGYRARESVMHMAAEMSDWLDKYVKNTPPRSSE